MALPPPKAIDLSLVEKAEKMLAENAALAEIMDKLHAQQAHMLYRRYRAYLQAGFSAEQAFALVKPE